MGYSEDFIPDGMNAFERNVKRIGDCIIAGVLLLIFSPLFLICYLVVKRKARGWRPGYLQTGACRSFWPPVLYL